MFSEAKFSTVEDEVSSPVFTNHIKQMVNSFRSLNLHSRGARAGTSRLETEKTLRDLVHKEHSVFLGEVYIGRKKVRIWVQDIRDRGMWNPGTKKTGSYVAVSLDVIIGNPASAVSIIIHELIHGLQKYQTFSDKYVKTLDKTSDETELDWFNYFTEPAELEAQLAELAHNIVDVFYRKKDKIKVINILNEILRKPKEEFANDVWYHSDIDNNYSKDLLDKHYAFIQSISKVPTEVETNKQYILTSNRCWRQFKQKLFNLVNELKSKTA